MTAVSPAGVAQNISFGVLAFIENIALLRHGRGRVGWGVCWLGGLRNASSVGIAGRKGAHQATPSAATLRLHRQHFVRSDKKATLTDIGNSFYGRTKTGPKDVAVILKKVYIYTHLAIQRWNRNTYKNGTIKKGTWHTLAQRVTFVRVYYCQIAADLGSYVYDKCLQF